MKLFLKFFFSVLLVSSCSKAKETIIVKECYEPVSRTLAPELAYGKVMWSEVPYPVPEDNAVSNQNLPLEVSFYYSGKKPSEAFKKFCKLLNYECDIQVSLEEKKIKLNLTSDVYKIAEDLSEKTSTRVYIDIDKRKVVVSNLE